MKKSSFLFLFFLSITVYAQEEKLQYPITKKSITWDDYHGTIVEDPYRWMENDTLSAMRQWVIEENELSEKYLNKQLFKYPLEYQLNANSYYSFGTLSKSGKYFFDRIRGEYSSSSSLYIKKDIRDKYAPNLAVDPSDYKANRKEIVSVRTYEMSGDSKYLAFSLSRNGSDWMEIRVKEVYPFKKCQDVITGVKFSRIKWKGNGFFYCRYQSMDKDKPLTSILVDPCLYYHKLGTVQEDDSLIFEYKGVNVFGSIDFDVLEDERFLILYHVGGKTNQFTVVSFWDYNDPLQKQFKTLATHPCQDRKFFEVVGMLNNRFVVYSNLGAPFKRVLSFDPAIPNKAKELIPEYDAVLTQVQLINQKLVCLYLQDIESLCITFDTLGKLILKLSYPPGSSVDGFEGTNKDTVTLFYYHSFLHPPVAYEYNLRTFKTSLIEQTKVSYDVNNFDMEKVFYQSKDGQKIPMIIAGKKGVKRDGSAPTVLYGYGGYGTTMTPFFNIGFITHMRNGGLVALPCIRGGGEYGDQWHDQGKLENKQTVFDDFIAAGEYLIANKYTSSQRLALMGGSNGGLLVAAVLTQRPELFKVGICEVGIYDMLRYHNYTVGYHWIKEFGVSQDSTQFKYLYKYSPLHNIKAGVKYPATLIITSDHDDRVVPMHSYKFAATLQEKTGGTDPILLYTQPNAGHNGTYGNKTDAYIYAFIYKSMGLRPRDVNPLY